MSNHPKAMPKPAPTAPPNSGVGCYWCVGEAKLRKGGQVAYAITSQPLMTPAGPVTLPTCMDHFAAGNEGPSLLVAKGSL